MFQRISWYLLTGILILAACAPQGATDQDPAAGSSATEPPDTVVTSPPPGSLEPPAPPPYEPSPEDENLIRGEAFVESADILVLESFPPQYTLTLRGSLPTPCNQLRVEVAEPDEQNQIQIDVYSVVDPNRICVQVLQSFEQSILLGSYPSGTYTVLVNGEQVGQIEAP